MPTRRLFYPLFLALVALAGWLAGDKCQFQLLRIAKFTFPVLSKTPTVGLASIQQQKQGKMVGIPMDRLKLSGPFTKKCQVNKRKLDEISGITSSAFSNSDSWVHNDSGGKPALYLLSGKGKRKLTVQVQGTKNKDWEDICRFQADGVSYLLVADVGDNNKKRKSVNLLVLEEPNRAEHKSDKITVKPVATLQFSYTDGPQNCESVAVSGNDIFLINKGGSGARPPKAGGKRQPRRATVYRLPLQLTGNHKGLKAKIVGQCPLVTATAMDISIDGRWMVVRDYWQICIYYRGTAEWSDRMDKAPDLKLISPVQRQSEAICFAADASEIWTTSEGPQPPIWKVKTTVRKTAKK